MTLEDELRRLSAGSSELDDLDTRLAQKIGLLEQELRKFVSVRVDVAVEPGIVLAFGRLGGAWRLVIERALDGRDPDQVALASCPRQMRARVFKDGHIMRLLVGAREHIAKMIDERGKAIASADIILDALEGGGQ